jgi:hypothetical protein
MPTALDTQLIPLSSISFSQNSAPRQIRSPSSPNARDVIVQVILHIIIGIMPLIIGIMPPIMGIFIIGIFIGIVVAAAVIVGSVGSLGRFVTVDLQGADLPKQRKMYGALHFGLIDWRLRSQ